VSAVVTVRYGFVTVSCRSIVLHVKDAEFNPSGRQRVDSQTRRMLGLD
jgi:hypothetical protein